MTGSPRTRIWIKKVPRQVNKYLKRYETGLSKVLAIVPSLISSLMYSLVFEQPTVKEYAKTKIE